MFRVHEKTKQITEVERKPGGLGVTFTASDAGEDWTGGEIGGRAASHRLAWLARKPALDLGRGRQLVVNGEVKGGGDD